MENLVMFHDLYRGRKVLVTGHTGFKGSWLTLWLQRLGAQVAGISLPPANKPSLFTLVSLDRLCESHFCDIREYHVLATLIHTVKPEIVFHLAAQPLVRASYADPLGTFATNVMGTAHLLDALRDVPSVRVVVVVTTDKVYRNNEWPYPYRENDHLGGYDPYSASKAASEIVIASYRDAFLTELGMSVASARTGNVIGGGDWSADRLIPDAVRAWQTNTPLEVRRPESVRPWQHILDPLHSYLALAHALWHKPALAGAYNFGPCTKEAATVREVVELARSVYGHGEITWGKGNDELHEAGLLRLEIAKAKSELGITSKWDLAKAVDRTMRWHMGLEAGEDARKLCEEDMLEYEKL